MVFYFYVSVHTHKNRKPYQKDTFFLWKKYFEDARQDEKHVQDLLESIIGPTDPVKEELRQKLFKFTQFEPKIKKIRVCACQMSGKIPDLANVAFEDPSSPLSAIFGPARSQTYGKMTGKMRVLARRALTTA